MEAELAGFGSCHRRRLLPLADTLGLDASGLGASGVEAVGQGGKSGASAVGLAWKKAFPGANGA